jgi:hypothetical protein
MRVPGFDAPDATAAPALPPPLPRGPRPPAELSARSGAKQLNVRVLLPLHHRYRRLLRELDDEGFDTSMSELVQSLLHSGPADADDAKRLIRSWRRALDPDL